MLSYIHDIVKIDMYTVLVNYQISSIILSDY